MPTRRSGRTRCSTSVSPEVQRYVFGSCSRWKAATRAIAVSIAAAISRSTGRSFGTILMSSGARFTPSNFAICSPTYASPRARTPAIVSSATRSARSLLSPRRASSSRSAASASGDPRFSGCTLSLLDPRDHFADLRGFRSIGVLADDQARGDLGDEVLQFELVYAHGLAGLDEVDDVRRQLEHRRELDRAAERDHFRADAALLQPLPRDS